MGFAKTCCFVYNFVDLSLVICHHRGLMSTHKIAVGLDPFQNFSPEISCTVVRRRCTSMHNEPITSKAALVHEL